MIIVVPIKGFSKAKQRLSAVLSEGERSELLGHMIDDVLGAIRDAIEIEGSRAGIISELIVVTNDAQVREQALAYGARMLPEPSLRPGLGNEALCAVVAMVANAVAGEGEDSLMMMPVDVPLLSANAILDVASHHARRASQSLPQVTVVAAKADGGTNALLMSPPEIIAPAFGHNSCQRHCELARQKNVEPVLLESPELSLDIDTVDDLQLLMAAPKQCHTQDYLQVSGIVGRIQARSKNMDGRLSG